MMMEAISWYVESLSAFWVSLASGGLFFKLILIWCLISWICGQRMRWRCHSHGCRGRCPHCGCWCGHCPCGAGEDGDKKGGDDKGGDDEDEEAV